MEVYVVYTLLKMIGIVLALLAVDGDWTSFGAKITLTTLVGCGISLIASSIIPVVVVSFFNLGLTIFRLTAILYPKQKKEKNTEKEE